VSPVAGEAQPHRASRDGRRPVREGDAPEQPEVHVHPLLAEAEEQVLAVRIDAIEDVTIQAGRAVGEPSLRARHGQ
jgi:hypothetical protein